jgi:hypothetical protein
MVISLDDLAVLDDLALKTLEIEDRPSPAGAIEDADEIAALLGHMAC